MSALGQYVHTVRVAVLVTSLTSLAVACSGGENKNEMAAVDHVAIPVSEACRKRSKSGFRGRARLPPSRSEIRNSYAGAAHQRVRPPMRYKRSCVNRRPEGRNPETVRTILGRTVLDAGCRQHDGTSACHEKTFGIVVQGRACSRRPSMPDCA
jgi:hypothetical protein